MVDYKNPSACINSRKNLAPHRRPEELINLFDVDVSMLRATIGLIRAVNPVLALSLQNRLMDALAKPSPRYTVAEASSFCDLQIDRYLLNRIADTAADASQERVRLVLLEGSDAAMSLEETLGVLDFWHRQANSLLSPR